MMNRKDAGVINPTNARGRKKERHFEPKLLSVFKTYHEEFMNIRTELKD